MKKSVNIYFILIMNSVIIFMFQICFHLSEQLMIFLKFYCSFFILFLLMKSLFKNYIHFISFHLFNFLHFKTFLLFLCLKLFFNFTKSLIYFSFIFHFYSEIWLFLLYGLKFMINISSFKKFRYFMNYQAQNHFFKCFNGFYMTV